MSWQLRPMSLSTNVRVEFLEITYTACYGYVECVRLEFIRHKNARALLLLCYGEAYRREYENMMVRHGYSAYTELQLEDNVSSGDGKSIQENRRCRVEGFDKPYEPCKP